MAIVAAISFVLLYTAVKVRCLCVVCRMLYVVCCMLCVVCLMLCVPCCLFALYSPHSAFITISHVYRPEYVANRSSVSRCVTITRDPLDRLRSLYLYARSGGEAWFRSTSGLMQALREPKTIEESIEVYWREFGKEYLVQSHEYYLHNIKNGCAVVKFEQFKTDYDGAVNKMLDTFQVLPDARDKLVDLLARHDLNRMTEQQLKADMHVSSSHFRPEFLAEFKVKLAAHPEIKQMVLTQRKELEMSD